MALGRSPLTPPDTMSFGRSGIKLKYAFGHSISMTLEHTALICLQASRLLTLMSKLTCCEQDQAYHSKAVGLPSHAVALRNRARSTMPSLTCCEQAQPYRSKAVACYDLPLHCATWHVDNVKAHRMQASTILSLQS